MISHSVRLLGLLGLHGSFAAMMAVVLVTQAIAQDNKPAEKKNETKKATRTLRPAGASTIQRFVT